VVSSTISTVSSLTYTEKRKLEEFLEMGMGYVLDFTNNSFREFVYESTKLDIYSDAVGGFGSKATRLRHFWNQQPDHIVGKLLKDLIAYRDGTLVAPDSFYHERLRQTCIQIAERLLQAAPVQDIEVIAVLSQREQFERLANEVIDCINKNEPESGLDRLHTFTMKFARSLCEKHRITVDAEKPLHSIFGEYVKKLKSSGLIETKMTETILKSSTSVLDAFNDVRNNRSLAHDNPVLNRNESLLIFQHVTSAIRFVWALEQSIPSPATEEIPF
jgi:hypothetical protein